MPAKGKTVVVRRSSGAASKKVSELKARMASRNQRQKAKSREMLADVSAIGGGALLGWLDTQKWTEKIDIPGIDDSAVYGLGMLIVGYNMSGTWGGAVKGMGVGMLSCAARDFVNGDVEV